MSPFHSRLTIFQEPAFRGNHVVLFPSRGEYQPTDPGCWIRHKVGSLILELPKGQSVRLLSTDDRQAELRGDNAPRFVDVYALRDHGLTEGLRLVVWDERPAAVATTE